MQAVGALLGAILGDVVDIEVAVIDSADVHTGKRVAALHPGQSGGVIGKIDRTGLVIVVAKNFLQVTELAAELYRMRAMYPGDEFIDKMRGPRGLVQGAEALGVSPAWIGGD